MASTTSSSPARGAGSRTRRRAGLPIVIAAALATCATAVSTQAPHFYPDDPIAREPESRDASKAQRYEIGSLYEMTHNLFITASYQPTGLRAKDINTIDEVPDSRWFDN